MSNVFDPGEALGAMGVRMAMAMTAGMGVLSQDTPCCSRLIR